MEDKIRKYLYSLREAADLLGVGRTTMYELINGGKLKVTRVGLRGIRISDAELTRYIQDNTEIR